MKANLDVQPRNMMNGGETMLENAFLLLMSGLFFALSISPGGGFPKPLSSAEEEEYLQRWLKGDVEARNMLVEHNLRLVAHIMKKYYTMTDDADDLISIGTIGLIKGINTYRPDKGVKLTTYASRCIENEILMYFRALKKSASDISLSESLDADSDGEGLSVLDVVASDEDLSECVANQEMCANLRGYVKNVLTPRESAIITMRYGLDNKKPLTQRDTAQRLGISRSYVSRIEKRALDKLRDALG